MNIALMDYRARERMNRGWLAKVLAYLTEVQEP
jgi:hypothetical protein